MKLGQYKTRSGRTAEVNAKLNDPPGTQYNWVGQVCDNLGKWVPISWDARGRSCSINDFDLILPRQYEIITIEQIEIRRFVSVETALTCCPANLYVLVVEIVDGGPDYDGSTVMLLKDVETYIKENSNVFH
jgi:hypothetical protein